MLLTVSPRQYLGFLWHLYKIKHTRIKNAMCCEIFVDLLLGLVGCYYNFHVAFNFFFWCKEEIVSWYVQTNIWFLWCIIKNLSLIYWFTLSGWCVKNINTFKFFWNLREFSDSEPWSSSSTISCSFFSALIKVLIKYYIDSIIAWT